MAQPSSTLDQQRIEQKTQDIGKALFDAVRKESTAFFSGERWTGQLLEWAMRHEETKIQLFRFIDVLPTLERPEDAVRHLKEYFEGRPDPFGGLMKAGLGLAGAGALGAHAASLTLRKAVEQVARSFIAGTNTREVIKVVKGFHQQHQGFTIDVLGEATLSEREAESYQERYLELLDALSQEVPKWRHDPQVDDAPWGRLPRVNVSVKLSALYSQLDPIDPELSLRRVMERLTPVLRLAREREAHIQIDMEDYSLKDLTFYIFQRLCESPELADYPHLGIVLQAYLKEAEEDARRLVEWVRRRGTPITVRLVKGAYWDFETVHARLMGWPVPVWERKWETDACYERVIRFFLENSDVIRLALGSHNIRSIAYAQALAQEMGLPPRSVEYQFLYGMANPLRKAVTQQGERVRIYTPYGQLIPGMAYLVRRLLENTANESFVRRGFSEGQSPEKLLVPPASLGEAAPEQGSGASPASSQAPQAAPVLQAAQAPQAPADASPPAGTGNGAAPAAPAAAGPRVVPIAGYVSGPEFGLPPYANQPPLNFALAREREAMAQALQQVRGQLGGRYPLVIGDETIETPETLVSVNPSQPQEIIGQTALAGEEHARRAVEVALKAFPAWRDTPVSRRVEIMRRAAQIMRERRYRLAALICLEAGKPWREADGDVCEAIDFLEWYSRQALAMEEPIRMAHLTGEINHYLYEPRGVAAIIAPWNFPLAILTGMSSAALVSGNAVVLKPAEQTPVIAHKLFEIYREAGVPAGVVNYLPGMGETAGAALVRHPHVHLIAFTGSRAVGLEILQQAAIVVPGQRHIKQVITELGGKNAVIVDDDADLDEAVAGVITSAFHFAGQKCSAASRAIVLDPLYDAFLERVVEAARSLVVGPAWEPATTVGPVIDAQARDRILGYIETGQREGRPLLVQEVPQRLRELGGYYVPPTVFADVSPDAVIATEEIFGPVLAVMRARDFDEAMRIALDSDYLLTGGIFSRSPARIARARREYRVGNFYINRKITGSLVGRQPFGGLGLSGTGFQSGGPDYLKQFVHTRVVTENTLRRGFADDA